MRDKSHHKIFISVSIAIATLFVLPWVSLFEFADTLREQIPSSKINSRLVSLWGSTFCSAIMFFYFNFYKGRVTSFYTKNRLINVSLTVAGNLTLVVLVSVFLLWFMHNTFQIEVRVGFLVVYFLRNLLVAFISMLVVYAYEKTRQFRNNQITMLSLEHEKAETELKVLKGQLDPHFIFNNFNALAGAIREDKKVALSFVSHMSETFRYSIERKDHHLVTLEEELRFLESYIYLMKIRFKEGLTTKINIDSQLLNKQLPHHALQLLFENAIKHNIVSLNKPLRIDVRSNDGHLIVANDLSPKKSSMTNTGLGLANLRKRYELLGYDSVHVLSNEDKFIVKLELI